MTSFYTSLSFDSVICVISGSICLFLLVIGLSCILHASYICLEFYVVGNQVLKNYFLALFWDTVMLIGKQFGPFETFKALFKTVFLSLSAAVLWDQVSLCVGKAALCFAVWAAASSASAH